MNTKLMLGAVSVLMLAIVPFAGAHNTSGAARSGPSGHATSGVSGTYVGPAGIGISENIVPLGDIINAVALCDLEVLGQGGPVGTDPTDVLNEKKVDGKATGGVVPDGTIDDGGIGAACHTHTYAEGGFNTAGCGTSNIDSAGVNTASSGVSKASDTIPIVHALVNIGAGCDDSSQVASPGITTCLINVVLQGGSGLPACQAQALGIVACAVSPLTCTPGAFAACGADGTTDTITFGTGAGTAYPTAAAGCNGVSTKVTYVLVGATTVPGVVGSGAMPASTGYIDE